MANAVKRTVMTSHTLIECSIDGTSAVNDVCAGSCVVHMVWIDNSANSVQANYVKFYDDHAPTVGTTAPVLDIEAEYDAGPRDGHTFIPLNFPSGLSFDNLSLACIEEAGPGATQTAPDAAVVITLLVT